MPKLVKVYLQQIAIGFGLSAVFTAILLYMNVGNLGHLVFNSSDGLLGPVPDFLLQRACFSRVCNLPFALCAWAMTMTMTTMMIAARPFAALTLCRCVSLRRTGADKRVAGPQRPWRREFPRT